MADAPSPWWTRPGPDRLLRVLAALLAAVGLVVHAAHYRDTWTDDAYISFRYARNLARGAGMVFNPGEHFEGLTNLGWAVVLAPLSDGDLLGRAQLLGLLCAVATVLVLAAWARRAGLGLAGTVVALAVLVGAPWLPHWSVQGMETPAVTLLLTLGWVRYLAEVDAPRGPLLSVPALGLAPAVRPDAALGVVVVGLWHLARRGGPRWTPRNRRAAGLVVLAGLALVALKLHWFGSVLPNPFFVKTGAGAAARGLRYLLRLATLPDPALPALLGLGLLVGLGLAVRRDDRALPAVLGLSWLAMVGAVGGDFMADFRLVVPAWPALAAALGVAVDRLVRAVARRGAPGTADVVALGAVLVVGGALWGPLHLDRVDQASSEAAPTPSTKAAPLLAPWRGGSGVDELEPGMPWPAAFTLVHAGAADDVATTDIGLPAWVNDRVPVVDLLALTDPVMAGRQGERWPEQWAYLGRRVRFMVLDVQGGAWVRFRDALARDGWGVVAACDKVWALANPARGPLAAPPLPEAELARRLDDLLRRAPRAAALHEAVARELAGAGAPDALVRGFVDRLDARHGPAWTAGSGAVLRCDLGWVADCTPRAEACGRRLARPDLASLGDAAAWPRGEAEGRAPQDPEQVPLDLPVDPGPGTVPTNPGLYEDDAEACEAARAAARDAWAGAVVAWDATGAKAPRARAQVAANRALAASDDAWAAARAAWREAATAPPDQAAAQAASRAAFAASEAARDTCRAGGGRPHR